MQQNLWRLKPDPVAHWGHWLVALRLAGTGSAGPSPAWPMWLQRRCWHESCFPLVLSDLSTQLQLPAVTGSWTEAVCTSKGTQGQARKTASTLARGHTSHLSTEDQGIMPIRMNESVLHLEKVRSLLIMDMSNNLFYTKIFSRLIIYVTLMWFLFSLGTSRAENVFQEFGIDRISIHPVILL